MTGRADKHRAIADSEAGTAHGEARQADGPRPAQVGQRPVDGPGGPRESRVPISVALDDTLTKAMHKVAGVIGIHADAAGCCYLKEATIADKAQLSRRTVQRALKGLCDRGHLKKRSTGRALALRWCAKNDASEAPKMTHQKRHSDPEWRTRSDSQESHQMRLSGVASHINGLSNEAAAAARAPDLEEDPRCAATANPPAAHPNTQTALLLLRWISERLGVDYGHDARALGVVRGWLDGGASESQVRAAVDRAAERRKFQAPLFVGYFDELVEEERLGAHNARRRRAGGTSPGSSSAKGGSPEGLEETPEPEGPEKWLAMRAALRSALGEDLYASWIAPLEFVCVTADGLLRLRAPSKFHADWLRRHHDQALRAAAVQTLNTDDVETTW